MNSNSPRPNPNPSPNPKSTASASYHQFLQGVGLYLFCIALPNLSSLLVHCGFFVSKNVFNIRFLSMVVLSDVQWIVLLTMLLSIVRMNLVRTYVGLNDFLKPGVVIVDRNDSSVSSNSSSSSSSMVMSPKLSQANWNAFMRTKSSVFLSNYESLAGSSDQHENASMDFTPENEFISRGVAQGRALAVTTTVQKTRYATALFRLIYSSIVSIFAIGYFQGSDFWSLGFDYRYIANVWRLSHGITCLFPSSDTLKEDAYAKYFYMLQISYHAQSVCFQVWLMSLAWLANANSTLNTKWTTKFTSIGTGYRKSLAFHSFVAILLMISYLFSSTRRLSVLVIFSINLANVGIYLLLIENFQKICLYGVTIPLFSYSFARIIFIWYSSIVTASREKNQWVHEFQHGLGMGNPYATTLFNIAINLAFALVTSWFIITGKHSFQKQKLN